MIQKILIAIDGSELAEKALESALDLAEKYSAHLVILNVFHPHIPFFYTTPIGNAFPLAGVDEYLKSLEASHKSMLEETLKIAKKRKPNLNISTKLVEGYPASKIVEIAKEENFDLIMLGHRGLSGIREFILGSVSNRVAHDAECPVLIIK